MADIHSTAIIEGGASLADDVSVGPYTVIGPQVTIGPGTVIDHHASIAGRTTMGSGNRVFPFASVGTIPQDLKYRGEDTELVIGDENIIREFATINIGTEGGGGITRIGNGSLIMAYAHVAHDCLIGDQVIMANCATLAGHIEIEDCAILGGLAVVHQFVRIGTHALVSGNTGVVMDIPPYTTASGSRAKLFGLNLVGLKRRGFSGETISGLKKAYKIIFRSNLNLEDAVARAREEVDDSPELRHLLDFIGKSKRGLTR